MKRAFDIYMERLHDKTFWSTEAVLKKCTGGYISYPQYCYPQNYGFWLNDALRGYTPPLGCVHTYSMYDYSYGGYHL